jgi:hypothetical protein
MHDGGMAPSGVVRVRRRKTRGCAITWDGGSVPMQGSSSALIGRRSALTGATSTKRALWSFR